MPAFYFVSVCSGYYVFSLTLNVKPLIDVTCNCVSNYRYRLLYVTPSVHIVSSITVTVA